MTLIQHPHPHAEVVAWTDERVAIHHAAAWDAWLHGTVAVMHDGDHDVLVVPVEELRDTAQHYAERLYRLGSVKRLTDRA